MPLFPVSDSLKCLQITSGSLDNSVKVWNLLENQQEAVLEGHTLNVRNVEITSENQFTVSKSDDNSVRVWSLQIILSNLIIE